MLEAADSDLGAIISLKRSHPNGPPTAAGAPIPHLGELERDPFRRRTCCYVDPDQFSALQTDDDEA